MELPTCTFHMSCPDVYYYYFTDFTDLTGRRVICDAMDEHVHIRLGTPRLVIYFCFY